MIGTYARAHCTSSQTHMQQPRRRGYLHSHAGKATTTHTQSLTKATNYLKSHCDAPHCTMCMQLTRHSGRIGAMLLLGACKHEGGKPARKEIRLVGQTPARRIPTASSIHICHLRRCSASVPHNHAASEGSWCANNACMWVWPGDSAETDRCICWP